MSDMERLLASLEKITGSNLRRVDVNLPFDPDLDGWDGEPDPDDRPVNDAVLSRFWEGEHLAGNP